MPDPSESAESGRLRVPLRGPWAAQARSGRAPYLARAAPLGRPPRKPRGAATYDHAGPIRAQPWDTSLPTSAGDPSLAPASGTAGGPESTPASTSVHAQVAGLATHMQSGFVLAPWTGQHTEIEPHVGSVVHVSPEWHSSSGGLVARSAGLQRSPSLPCSQPKSPLHAVSPATTVIHVRNIGPT